MGILNKLAGTVVYIIKTPLTNGENAYRFGKPIAAVVAFYYFILKGEAMEAVISYLSIKFLPPLSVEDLVVIGWIVIGAAVLMGGRYFVAMVVRDL